MMCMIFFSGVFPQMSNKRSNSFRRAIQQGARQLKGSSLREEVGLGLSQRLVRHVAYETLPREVDRKWYFDSYTYCPPPWLILSITFAEASTELTTLKNIFFYILDSYFEPFVYFSDYELKLMKLKHVLFADNMERRGFAPGVFLIQC